MLQSIKKARFLLTYSEITTQGCSMAAKQGIREFRPKLVAPAVASCFASSTVLANPTEPTVVNGQVSILQNGNLLQVTNSPSSIINWQSFSIGANEITRFIQQS